MGDITLDQLFRARKGIELPDKTNIFVRSLSDTERRQKQLASLRASVRLDQKLADENSDEYAVYLYPLKQLSRDDLLEILKQWKLGNAIETSAREFEPEYIPFPENADDEETKRVLLHREEAEKQLIEKRKEYVERLVDDYIASAEKWSDDVLLKEAIARKRMVVSLEEVLNEDAYQAVYLGTETSEGKRYFRDIAAVRSLPTNLLFFLLENQREVDNVNLWEVTKSGDGRQTIRLVDADKAPEPAAS